MVIIREKIKHSLNNKKGISTTTGMLWAILVTAVLISFIIGIGDQLHKRFTLGQFADELASKVSIEGRCSGKEIEERYNQLCESTKLKPQVIYHTNYYNSAKKTVQYGDDITIELILETKLLCFGNDSGPFKYTHKVTTQSMQYWKE